MTLPSFLRKITVPARRIRGGRYLGEIFRKAYSKSGRQEAVNNFDGDLSIDLDLGEHMQSQIFWHGSYSGEILSLLRRVLKPGMTFVDGGANIGEISLVAAKQVGAKGRVISFEPLDRFADQLAASRARNDLSQIELVRAGLSSSKGEAKIFLAPANFADGTHHDGLGTLYQTGARSKVAATIPLVRLDDYMGDDPVHVLKLDVEGAELEALKGARNILERDQPEIIIEVGRETCAAAGYEPEEICDLLRECGYSLYLIGRKGSLRLIQPDRLGMFQNLFCTTNPSRIESANSG